MNTQTETTDKEQTEQAKDPRSPPMTLEESEQLDEEEAEFRAIRRDLPGVKGASAAGIVTNPAITAG